MVLTWPKGGDISKSAALDLPTAETKRNIPLPPGNHPGQSTPQVLVSPVYVKFPSHKRTGSVRRRLRVIHLLSDLQNRCFLPFNTFRLIKGQIAKIKPDRVDRKSAPTIMHGFKTSLVLLGAVATGHAFVAPGARLPAAAPFSGLVGASPAARQPSDRHG